MIWTIFLAYRVLNIVVIREVFFQVPEIKIRQAQALGVPTAKKPRIRMMGFEVGDLQWALSMPKIEIQTTIKVFSYPYFKKKELWIWNSIRVFVRGLCWVFSPLNSIVGCPILAPLFRNFSIFEPLNFSSHIY